LVVTAENPEIDAGFVMDSLTPSLLSRGLEAPAQLEGRDLAGGAAVGESSL